MEDITKTGEQTYKLILEENQKEFSNPIENNDVNPIKNNDGYDDDYASLLFNMLLQQRAINYTIRRELKKYGYSTTAQEIYGKGPTEEQLTEAVINSGYGSSKYDEGLTAYDIYYNPNIVNENRAANLTWIEKVGNGFAKAAVNTLVTALDSSIGTVVNPIMYLAGEGFIDNPWSQALHGFQEDAFNIFQNYESEYTSQLKWYEKAFTGEGFSNMFSDGILTNLGFMAGAALGGAAWTAPLNAVMQTSKARNVLKGIASMLGVGKDAKTTKELVLELSKAGLREDVMALVNKAASQLTKREAAVKLTNALANALPEARMEALDSADEFSKEKLLQIEDRFNFAKLNIDGFILMNVPLACKFAKTGIEDNSFTRVLDKDSQAYKDAYNELLKQITVRYSDEKDELARLTRNVENTVFGLNIPTIMAENIVTIPLSFMPYNTVNKAKNLLTATSRTSRKGLRLVGETGRTVLIGNDVVHVSKGKIALEKTKQIFEKIKGPIGEAGLEFLQTVESESSLTYYGDKYNTYMGEGLDERGLLSSGSLFHDFLNISGEKITTFDIEDAVLGFLTPYFAFLPQQNYKVLNGKVKLDKNGNPLKTISFIPQAWKDLKGLNLSKLALAQLEALQAILNDPEKSKFIHAAVRNDIYNQDRIVALHNNDKKMYDKSQLDLALNMAIQAVENGNADWIKEMIEDNYTFETLEAILSFRDSLIVKTDSGEKSVFEGMSDLELRAGLEESKKQLLSILDKTQLLSQDFDVLYGSHSSEFKQSFIKDVLTKDYYEDKIQESTKELLDYINERIRQTRERIDKETDLDIKDTYTEDDIKLLQEIKSLQQFSDILTNGEIEAINDLVSGNNTIQKLIESYLNASTEEEKKLFEKIVNKYKLKVSQYDAQEAKKLNDIQESNLTDERKQKKTAKVKEDYDKKRILAKNVLEKEKEKKKKRRDIQKKLGELHAKMVKQVNEQQSNEALKIRGLLLNLIFDINKRESLLAKLQMLLSENGDELFENWFSQDIINSYNAFTDKIAQKVYNYISDPQNELRLLKISKYSDFVSKETLYKLAEQNNDKDTNEFLNSIYSISEFIEIEREAILNSENLSEDEKKENINNLNILQNILYIPLNEFAKEAKGMTYDDFLKESVYHLQVILGDKRNKFSKDQIIGVLYYFEKLMKKNEAIIKMEEEEKLRAEKEKNKKINGANENKGGEDVANHLLSQEEYAFMMMTDEEVDSMIEEFVASEKDLTTDNFGDKFGKFLKDKGIYDILNAMSYDMMGEENQEAFEFKYITPESLSTTIDTYKTEINLLKEDIIELYSDTTNNNQQTSQEEDDEEEDDEEEDDGEGVEEKVEVEITTNEPNSSTNSKVRESVNILNEENVVVMNGNTQLVGCLSIGSKNKALGEPKQNLFSLNFYDDESDEQTSLAVGVVGLSWDMQKAREDRTAELTNYLSKGLLFIDSGDLIRFKEEYEAAYNEKLPVRLLLQKTSNGIIKIYAAVELPFDKRYNWHEKYKKYKTTGLIKDSTKGESTKGENYNMIVLGLVSTLDPMRKNQVSEKETKSRLTLDKVKKKLWEEIENNYKGETDNIELKFLSGFKGVTIDWVFSGRVTVATLKNEEYSGDNEHKELQKGQKDLKEILTQDEMQLIVDAKDNNGFTPFEIVIKTNSEIVIGNLNKKKLSIVEEELNGKIVRKRVLIDRLVVEPNSWRAEGRENVGHTKISNTGRIYIRTVESDGRVYYKAIEMKYFDDSFNDNCIYGQKIRECIKAIVNKTGDERNAQWAGLLGELSKYIYLPTKKRKKGGGVLKLTKSTFDIYDELGDRISINIPENATLEKKEEVVDEIYKAIKQQGFRFTMGMDKSITLNDIIESNIISTDLGRLHNIGASVLIRKIFINENGELDIRDNNPIADRLNDGDLIHTGLKIFTEKETLEKYAVNFKGKTYAVRINQEDNINSIDFFDDIDSKTPIPIDSEDYKIVLSLYKLKIAEEQIKSNFDYKEIRYNEFLRTGLSKGFEFAYVKKGSKTILYTKVTENIIVDSDGNVYRSDKNPIEFNNIYNLIKNPTSDKYKKNVMENLKEKTKKKKEKKSDTEVSKTYNQELSAKVDEEGVLSFFNSKTQEQQYLWTDLNIIQKKEHNLIEGFVKQLFDDELDGYSDNRFIENEKARKTINKMLGNLITPNMSGGYGSVVELILKSPNGIVISIKLIEKVGKDFYGNIQIRIRNQENGNYFVAGEINIKLKLDKLKSLGVVKNGEFTISKNSSSALLGVEFTPILTLTNKQSANTETDNSSLPPIDYNTLELIFDLLLDLDKSNGEDNVVATNSTESIDKTVENQNECLIGADQQNNNNKNSGNKPNGETKSGNNNALKKSIINKTTINKAGNKFLDRK